MAKRTKLKITLKNDCPSLEADFSKWLKEHEKSYPSYSFWDFGEIDLYDEDYMGDYYDGNYDVYGYPREKSDWWDDGQDDNDDEYDDDYRYENYWDKKYHAKDKKKNKRGSRGKKKKADLTDPDSLTDSDIDEILHEKKEIYFYDDIADQKTVHKFTSLQKFYNFLEDNDIELEDREGSKFIRERVRHCCIDPIKLDVRHKKFITSDHSYGALSYEVSSESSIFDY